MLKHATPLLFSHLTRGFAVMLLVVPLAQAVQAQQAVIDISKVGPDFKLVGEYVGTVTTGPQKFEQLFLQVRAIGEGNYEGAQYLGGLPMKPEEKRPLMRLLGRRNEQFLVLSGGPWAVLAKLDHCLVINPAGKQIGRLERVVRQSPSVGVKPPKNAVVLFDGTDTKQFARAQITDDGLLVQGADVKPLFHDFNMHLEFLVPFVPKARGQARGNSGVYLQSSYEVQVLDSFALEPKYNDCGALYRFRPPNVNVCFPPLTWQTYDIIFTAPRWNADGSKRAPGRVTVWHNGVKIHDDVELPKSTGSGKEDDRVLEPIRLQDHSNPVRYRNIWVVDRGLAPPESFPIFRDLEKEAAEKAAKEKAAKEKAEKEKAAREKAAKERAAAEKAAKEKAAKEKEAKEKEAKEQAAEKAAADKAAKAEAARKKAAQQQAAKEAAEQQAEKDKSAKEDAGKDKAAKEKEAKEKAASEAAKQKAAEDKAAKEKAAKEKAAKAKAAKEHAAKEAAAKKAAKEETAKKQAAKEQASKQEDEDEKKTPEGKK